MIVPGIPHRSSECKQMERWEDGKDGNEEGMKSLAETGKNEK